MVGNGCDLCCHQCNSSQQRYASSLNFTAVYIISGFSYTWSKLFSCLVVLWLLGSCLVFFFNIKSGVVSGQHGLFLACRMFWTFMELLVFFTVWIKKNTYFSYDICSAAVKACLCLAVEALHLLPLFLVFSLYSCAPDLHFSALAIEHDNTLLSNIVQWLQIPPIPTRPNNLPLHTKTSVLTSVIDGTVY
jgi:hypothetical protein